MFVLSFFFFSSRRRHTRWNLVTGVRRVLFRSIQKPRAGAGVLIGQHRCLMRRLTRLIRPTYFLQFIEFAQICRLDKAFTPHPASGLDCLTRLLFPLPRRLIRCQRLYSRFFVLDYRLRIIQRHTCFLRPLPRLMHHFPWHIAQFR